MRTGGGEDKNENGLLTLMLLPLLDGQTSVRVRTCEDGDEGGC